MSAILLHSIDARDLSVLRGYNTSYNFFVTLCVYPFCAITLITEWKICHVCGLCLFTYLSKNVRHFLEIVQGDPNLSGFFVFFPDNRKSIFQYQYTLLNHNWIF